MQRLLAADRRHPHLSFVRRERLAAVEQAFLWLLFPMAIAPPSAPLVDRRA